MEGVWATRAVLTCLVALAFAAPAHASTTIGMVATSDADNCTPNTEFMQNTVGATTGYTPSYDVPAPGGVIVSWSTKPGSGTGTGARLKVYRPTSDPYVWTVVGESSAKILTPDTVNTGTTRIPVQGGDRIAVRTASGNGGPCDFPYPAGIGPGYSMFSFQSMTLGFDPPAASEVTFIDQSGQELVNIAAVVEPDADGDGFGDETQDKCIGANGPDNGCPVAVPSPPEPLVPLSVNTHVRSVQHVLRQHGIVLVVQPSLASTVSATATVSIPSAGRVVRFVRASRDVTANGKATLKLKLPKSKLARVKRALRAHRKLFARAVVTTSASGNNPAVKRFKIRLKP